MKFAMFSLALAASLLAQPSATLVLTHGKVWTVNPAHPQAEAVACIGSHIVAVGSSDEIGRWIGPKTHVIDLKGRLVLPGFYDAHVHFFSGGEDLASVQLRTARSPEEFRGRIRDYAATLPSGQWVTGGNWDHQNWTPARLPARQLIDGVTGGHPVFVSRLDGHMGLANSLALTLAHINRNTPDPPGGVIVRDSNGDPTGILKDAAQGFIDLVLPPPSEKHIAAAIRAAMRYANENGVTSVEDMSASPEVLRVYEELLRNDALTVRISGHQPLAEWRRQANAGITSAFGGEKLRIGALKGFADGSLGSGTALFFEPYLDNPNSTGIANEEMIPESKMRAHIIEADGAGLQISIHAIGDKANKLILDFMEDAEQQNGPRDRRFRIEHAQHLRQQDIPRFAKLHVIASMQPYHVIDDGRWAEKKIGPEVIRGTYAFRSLLDSGAVLAFGSDWDVAPMAPIMGIYAAATRRTLDGKHPNGWIPEQKISVAEAIRAYTMGSAYASFTEKIKGSIEPGKLADLVVLSDDILTIDPVQIEKTSVITTIFDGRIVFNRE